VAVRPSTGNLPLGHRKQLFDWDPAGIGFGSDFCLAVANSENSGMEQLRRRRFLEHKTDENFFEKEAKQNNAEPSVAADVGPSFFSELNFPSQRHPRIHTGLLG